ncbi:hypothetical protein GH714_021604 [Hevea brasiliensis]|uniref:Uncharacterized protein n=1 Tax=Hevea brasiliensis TaxID=3981 RepID=A0A6A6LLA7_HEVBR|nr:hypothetical protein GH714_021604 [Hevea brasiliensis]
MGISGVVLGGVGFGVRVEESLLVVIFMARSLGMCLEGCLVRIMGGTVKLWGDMPHVIGCKMNDMRHVEIKGKSDMPRVIVHEVLHEACETP